jgi:hypothetical protein
VDVVSTPPDEIAMHEYDTLRAEIGRHEEQIFQAFTYSLGGSVAIVSWGLSNKNWAVLLLVPFILLPAGFLILSRVQMEKRIGAYIRFFYERRSRELNWETALELMTADNAAGSGRSTSPTPRSMIDTPEGALVIALALPLFTVGIASVVAAWVIGSATPDALPWLITGSVIVAVLVVTIVVVMIRITSRPLTSQYFAQIEEHVQTAKSTEMQPSYLD